MSNSGCPYCKGAGDCYGQCDERFKAMVKMIAATLRRLNKGIAKILRAEKRRKKS